MADISKIFRAYKTLQQMLHDRGYQVSDQELKISMEDFKTQKL